MKKRWIMQTCICSTSNSIQQWRIYIYLYIFVYLVFWWSRNSLLWMNLFIKNIRKTLIIFLSFTSRNMKGKNCLLKSNELNRIYSWKVNESTRTHPTYSNKIGVGVKKSHTTHTQIDKNWNVYYKNIKRKIFTINKSKLSFEIDYVYKSFAHMDTPNKL